MLCVLSIAVLSAVLVTACGEDDGGGQAATQVGAAADGDPATTTD